MFLIYVNVLLVLLLRMFRFHLFIACLGRWLIQHPAEESENHICLEKNLLLPHMWVGK